LKDALFPIKTYRNLSMLLSTAGWINVMDSSGQKIWTFHTSPQVFTLAPSYIWDWF